MQSIAPGLRPDRNGGLPSDLGSRRLPACPAIAPVFSADAASLAFGGERISGSGRRFAGPRSSRPLALPAFWRRLNSHRRAAVVTVASRILFPGQTIWFGILHCVAAASLLALLLSRRGHGVPCRGRHGDLTAILRPFGAVRSAGFALARPWRGVAEHGRLVSTPALVRVVLVGLGAVRLPRVLGRLTSSWRWWAKSRAAQAVCFAETQPGGLSASPGRPFILSLERRGLGPCRRRASARTRLWRVSGGLRARLRIPPAASRGIISAALRRRRGRACPAKPTGRRTRRRAPIRTQAHRRRLHGAPRVGLPP